MKHEQSKLQCSFTIRTSKKTISSPNISIKFPEKFTGKVIQKFSPKSQLNCEINEIRNKG